MKLFIWVQHLFGLGHVRRMARIAEACGAEGMAVTVTAGGSGGRQAFHDLPGVSAHQLPPLRTADHQYTGLLTARDEAPDDAYWLMRREAMLACLDAAAPDIVMLELFPFGRRKFAAEALALLDGAGALPSRPLIVSSVRDIIEPKGDPRKMEEMAGWLKTHFDAVLVHGMEEVIPLAVTAPFVADAGVPLHYTGYVAPEAKAAPEKRGVTVSAGSGASGAALLSAAAEAGERAATAGRPWHLFVPHGVPTPACASAHVHIHPFTEEFPAFLARAEISIGEAGYNTCAEALAYGARPVLVPYDRAGQTEQPRRAAAFAAAGLAIHIEPKELSAATLLAATARARALPPPQGLNLSGTKHAAVILKGLRTRTNAS